MKIALSLILTLFSFCLNSQNFDKSITKLSSKFEANVIELRHWFHQNAELSNREFKTAERFQRN